VEDHHVSEPHRLIVHEHPEDGIDVLHPDSCPRREEDWGGGFTVVSYDCVVDWHSNEGGMGHDLWHAFADDERYPFTNPHVLLPGVYQARVVVVKYRAWEAWGGYEYDIETYVEPQAAITTGRDQGDV
jgi:hypothetical protein